MEDWPSQKPHKSVRAKYDALRDIKDAFPRGERFTGYIVRRPQLMTMLINNLKELNKYRRKQPEQQIKKSGTIRGKKIG